MKSTSDMEHSFKWFGLHIPGIKHSGHLFDRTRPAITDLIRRFDKPLPKQEGKKP